MQLILNLLTKLPESHFTFISSAASHQNDTNLLFTVCDYIRITNYGKKGKIDTPSLMIIVIGCKTFFIQFIDFITTSFDCRDRNSLLISPRITNI